MNIHFEPRTMAARVQGMRKGTGRIAGLAVLLAMASTSGVVWAHHSTALYDFTLDRKLEGVVRSFQWANPHNYAQILVTDDDGKVTEWAVEVGTPATATRMGWAKDSLKPGDHISIVVAPARDGTPAGTLKTATLADGRTLKSVAADPLATKPFESLPSVQRATPRP
jgi:hypothetical protein